MKKLLITLITGFSLLLNPITAQTVTLESTLGIQEFSTQPHRIAVFDLGALDTIDVLGGSKNVIAIPKETPIPQNLTQHTDEYQNVGRLTDPNFEKLNEATPDLNIISARQNRFISRFEEIAPTYFSNIDINDFYPSFERNILNIAKVLNKTELADQKLAELREQISNIKKNTLGKTALILLVNESKLSTYGEKSRFGLIFQQYGFTPVDNDIDAATHGMSVGFEYILTHNPDYIFVVDRTAALTDKKDNASTVLNNNIIKQTVAYKNNHIIYLNAANWYLAMGGLNTMKLMNEEIERALKQ